MALRNRFIFLVTGRNCGPYLQACLDSIEAQEFDDLGLLIADDHSSDDSTRMIKAFLADSTAVRDHVFIRSPEQKPRSYRIHELMSHVDGDSSMVAFLNAHDRLINPHVARRMAWALSQGVDVAYSNFRYRLPIDDSPLPYVGTSRPLPEDFEPYRSPHITSHLFCFRAELYPRIDPINYRDNNGGWFECATEQCFTLPLLHLAKRIAFVPEYFVECNNDIPQQSPDEARKANDETREIRRRGFLTGPVR